MRTDKTAAYASLYIKDFRDFLLARSLTTLALLMQNTVLAWQIYEITGDKLALGLIGLSEAIPYILTTFWSGYAADHYSRRRILVLATAMMAASAGALALGSWYTLGSQRVWGYYVVIAIVGICRSFYGPSSNAIQSRIVPRELYANSSTWSSTAFQISAVAGPIIGGLLLGIISPWAVYLLGALIFLMSFGLSLRFEEHQPPPQDGHEPFVRSFFGGLRFVFGTQAILSSISLDLFAVLFGGVIGLVPAFCKDILHVGPAAMGLLKSSQFLGSAVMGFILAHYPPTRHAGRNLLWSIGIFGLCIIGFALSESYVLSFALLFLSGSFDNVSVIIRSTIIQLFTPDNMRGRVSAVNSIFIKSSNEIGDFESGLAASMIGLVPAVILGGTVTLAVVGFTAICAPKLRKLKL
jgi:sugar phosphate permease